MSNRNKIVHAVCAIAIGLTPLTALSAQSTVKASAFSLKTSVQEVIGVREIEAGDYLAGIRKSKAALDKVTVNSLKSPLLTNLCVAHIAIEDFANAGQYCDAAIAASQNAISHNNRAVLHCITGDIDACAADLEKAKVLKGTSRVIAKNIAALEQYNLVVNNH